MRLIDADAITTENQEVLELMQNAPTVKNAVVLPFMPGDDLWFLDEDDGYRVKCYAEEDESEKIHGVAVYKDRFEIIGFDGLSYPAGKMFSCTSKDEAYALRRKLIAESLARILMAEEGMPHAESE